MKRILITVAILSSALISFGQNNNEKILLNEDNGVKTLTISKTNDGKTVTETFKAEEAEAKLVELEKKGNLSKTIIIDEAGTMFTKIEYVTSTK